MQGGKGSKEELRWAYLENQVQEEQRESDEREDVDEKAPVLQLLDATLIGLHRRKTSKKQEIRSATLLEKEHRDRGKRTRSSNNIEFNR